MSFSFTSKSIPKRLVCTMRLLTCTSITTRFTCERPSAMSGATASFSARGCLRPLHAAHNAPERAGATALEFRQPIFSPALSGRRSCASLALYRITGQTQVFLSSFTNPVYDRHQSLSSLSFVNLSATGHEVRICSYQRWLI